MKKIHLIKTENTSRLLLSNRNHLQFLKDNSSTNPNNNFGGVYVHIYITCDEKIKAGDYFWKPDCNMIFKAEYTPHKGCQKVILTTDQDLIADGIQVIDDEFLNWFVNNPSCEEVEVKDIRTIPALQLGSKNGHLMYEIIIPQEESKPELLPDFKITQNIFDFVTDLLYTNKKESTLESAKTDWDSLIGAGLDESLKEWDEPKKERKPWSFCETPEEKCTMNYCDENGCQNRERVLVEPKQETLEEEAKEGYNNMPFGIGLIKRRSVFLLGAKWQAERMYSDEEVGELVYNIIGEYGKHYGIMIDGAKLNELFEQFKKK